MLMDAHAHMRGCRVNLPFDRHDWTVDRCGKEVRYCIDYYDTEDSYWIDARPMVRAPHPPFAASRLPLVNP